MSNGTKTITQLTTATTFSNSDLLLVVQNVGGTAVTNSINPNTILVGVSSYTSNNTNYVGTVSAANVVSNAQLKANLAIINATSISVGTTFVANSTQLNFTTNTFNLGSSTKAANGYTWLPNGTLMQWGVVTSNSSTGAVAFPVAFPTACQAMSLTVVGSSNSAYHGTAPTITAANVRTTSTTTAISVQYLAIGY